MPDARTLRYLESLSRRYYQEKARLVLPRDIGYREFAAQLWGSTSYVRHMSFPNEASARKYAAEHGPRHFYYSSARYDQPAAKDMDAKGWLGSDLVFDIDADHLPQCEGSVVAVEEPSLGIKASFAPHECIREAAIQAYLLVDVLTHELGFSRDSVRVEFSGHRGFHVIVDTRGTEWEKADSEVRRELINYVKAVDLDEETLYPKPPSTRKRFVLLEPSESDPGLRGRLARFSKLLERLGKPSDAAREYLSIEVDEQVTVDTKRLIRVPGSLNGKTMLPVIEVEIDKLPDFELTPDLSPFADLGRVRVVPVVDTPVIEVLGHRLKLRRGVAMKLEAPVALYLLAKEVAVLR